MADSNSNRPRTWLTCMGDATDPKTWSSTPYHTLQEGKHQGLIDEGLPLQPAMPWVRRSRLIWNMFQVFRLRSSGGFQYSSAFLERLWNPFSNKLDDSVLINNFQLFPDSVMRNRSIRKWYYLDATVRLVSDYYGVAVGKKKLESITARERDQYAAAEGVMTMSGFAARSVIEDYGIPAERVHVIVPGANLTRELYAQVEQDWASWRNTDTGLPLQRDDSGLKLVFVGRDLKRKGLDRLIRALALARARGSRATLRVIGLAADDAEPDLRAVEGVEWHGLIPRDREIHRLFKLVATSDVGCLLSRAEFSAIAIREYLAVGLPVIGPAAGGCLDLMPPEACWSVKPDDTDEQVADLITRIENNRDELELHRAYAWANRRAMLWEPAVARMAQIMKRE